MIGRTDTVLLGFWPPFSLVFLTIELRKLGYSCVTLV